MLKRSEEEQPRVLNCPKCGATLAAGAVGCGYCQSEFVQAVGVAPEKPADQVVEKDGKKVIGEISFSMWGGLPNSALVAIAAQIAEETPKVLMAKPAGERSYTNFTLPLPPKAGCSEAYLAEVFRKDDEGLTVCLSAEFPLETHQRLRAEGRELRLP